LNRILAVSASAVACGLVLVGTAEAAKPARRPAVTWLEAAPQSVPAAGGTVLVRAYVQGAARCTLAARHGGSGAFATVKTVACASGHASIRAKVAANRTKHLVGVWFRLTAKSARGVSVTKKIEVTQETRTPKTPKQTAPAPAPTPLTVFSTTLPTGAVGVGYTTKLVAFGGTGPYTWSLASGALPTGLTLGDAIISGTPTAPGASAFTLQVTDAKGATATQNYTFTVNAPPPITSLGPAFASLNWSGYVLTGGTYTGVTGTFNVPTIAPTSTDTHTSEWIGIDGAVGGDQNLIQAGVTEQFSASSGTTVVYAWTEELPAPENPISLAVAPGDEITVDISMIGSGLWDIYLLNDTTGDSYSVTETYSGVGSSAEWIVEAPMDATTQAIDTVGSFSPVTFTQLGVNPVAGSLADTIMLQNGIAVSVPSPLSSNGFTVAYGSVAPAAP
jgi:Peptidase A4 family/Putative Ig domain